MEDATVVIAQEEDVVRVDKKETENGSTDQAASKKRKSDETTAAGEKGDGSAVAPVVEGGGGGVPVVAATPPLATNNKKSLTIAEAALKVDEICSSFFESAADKDNLDLAFCLMYKSKALLEHCFDQKCLSSRLTVDVLDAIVSRELGFVREMEALKERDEKAQRKKDKADKEANGGGAGANLQQ